MNLDRTDIARVRHRAQRCGLTLTKRRPRRNDPRHLGGLRIMDGRTQQVLAGERYDLDADAADQAIDRLIAEGRAWNAR